MEATAECRWWAPGTWDPTVTAWFTDQGATAAPERRTDHYLHIPGRPGIGVKARAGELLEVKVRSARGALRRFTDRAEGHIEHWRKWSFPLRSAAAGVADLDVTEGDWIRVQKRRWLLEVEGCEIELAEVDVLGRPYRSLGAEAADGTDGVASVASALTDLFVTAEGRLGRFVPDRSHGYPQQLLLVGVPEDVDRTL